MYILAISSSKIVFELLNMVLKGDDREIEFVNSIEEAQEDSYNIIFIDDTTSDINTELESIINNYSYDKLIFIGSNPIIEAKVDMVIKKPFLPKDIKEIIESIDIKPLIKKDSASTNVLDLDEIEKIKALMNLDDEEEEDNINYESSFFELLEDKESLNLKKKGAKEFLYECTNLNRKELKKLLKGAKVSIKIKFKSSDNE